MQARTRRPSPALVISIIALIAALTGTAFAAGLGKNSVGSRQLKSKAVTTGKIANNSVTGAKVAKETLTGEDIKVGQLGTVPNATNAAHAQNADTLGDNHAAACPAGIDPDPRHLLRPRSQPGRRGRQSRGQRRARPSGGFLPTPMELYSVRNVINLGTGIAPDYAVADQYYANTVGVNYRTVTVDGAGKIEEIPVEANTEVHLRLPVGSLMNRPRKNIVRAVVASFAALLVFAAVAVGEVDEAEYKTLVEPICKTNKEASDRLLSGVKKLVKEDKLKQAGTAFAKAAEALEKAQKQLVDSRAASRRRGETDQVAVGKSRRRSP